MPDKVYCYVKRYAYGKFSASTWIEEQDRSVVQDALKTVIDAHIIEFDMNQFESILRDKGLSEDTIKAYKERLKSIDDTYYKED